MPGRRSFIFVILVLSGSHAPILAESPLGTDFTYQGQLKATGMPAISTADFQVSVFDADLGGNQVGATLSRENTAIVNGLFSLSLDFGAPAFNGNARWLQVAVRSPAGAGGFTTLTPRQPVTATPNSTYSLQTRGITVDATGQVGIGTSTPGKRLTVAGDMELVAGSNNFPHLRIAGDSGDGFLCGSSPGSEDRMNLGFNVFTNQLGNNQIVNLSIGSSQLRAGAGSIVLATGSPGHSSSPRMVIDEEGNVEINGELDAGLINAGSVTTNSFFKNHGQMQVIGGQQHIFDPPHLIWKLGQYDHVDPPNFTVKNPELKMISPVTSDELAGFYRDFDSGNGVMFADDKNFRAPNPADPATDIWYCCPEGPEAAMYVRGTGRLIDGRATIELPDHFRNLASEPGMTVQLTPLTIECKGLGVVKKCLSGIVIGEIGGGAGNYEFDWRVEAVRKGWEDYKVIRPWLRSDENPDKAWQNRLKQIEERRAHGKPSPVVSADTPRPSN